MKVALSGSSGLVGSHLQRFLTANGHAVFPLVRHSPSAANEIYWNYLESEIESAKLESMDAVVHLAGANLADRRWTRSFKHEIEASRVEGTKLIARTLARLPRRPAVLISASALGFYGDRGEELLTEESEAGLGFLADTARLWEAAALPARDAGIRVVNLRIGVVLSPAGGALKKMLPPFKLGLGGKVGTGRQWVSWVSLTDLLAIIEFCLSTRDLTGPINAVAPFPVRNEEFSRTLADLLHRPCFARVPAVVARAMFGEMADETVLISSRIAPQRLLSAGFKFQFPVIREALAHELSH